MSTCKYVSTCTNVFNFTYLHAIVSSSGSRNASNKFLLENSFTRKLRYTGPVYHILSLQLLLHLFIPPTYIYLYWMEYRSLTATCIKSNSHKTTPLMVQKTYLVNFAHNKTIPRSLANSILH